MNGIKRLTLGLVAAAVLAVVLIGGIFSATGVSAGGTPTVTIGSLDMDVGEKQSVDLSALNIDAPGLGAWSITVDYDTGVISVTDCTPTGTGFCNNNTPGTAIVVGANPNGQEGDSVLATLNIMCGSSPGTTALTITVTTLSDATLGDPQPITHTVSNGSVTCSVPPTDVPPTEVPPTDVPPTEPPDSTAAPTIAPPDTGVGGSAGGGSSTWLIATLAAIAVAAAAGFGALKLSARRS